MRASLQIDLRSIDRLSEADWSDWAQMRAENTALQSPYFHPDYVKTIAALGRDVSIVCARENGKPRAFLPIQGKAFARPVGAPMSDYHGIIQASSEPLSYDDLLRPAGVGALHFGSAIDPQSLSPAQVSSEMTTAAFDLDGDPDGWRAARDGSYKRHLKSNRRRIRKAEDEIGARRFVFKSRDIDVFQQLIAWKKEKFALTGKYDVLSAEWTLGLIRGLWEQPSAGGLRCEMQALYFGERLAAVDLGLTDGEIFHSWIVAYDGELHSFGPGIQLLEAMIDAAPELGYRRIDMGAGLDGYKRHYASDGTQVAAGFVPLSGPAASLSRIYGKAERWGEQALSDAPGKLRRRYSQIAACEDSLGGRTKALSEAVITAFRKPAEG